MTTDTYSLRLLKEDARGTAQWRGHVLSRFESLGETRAIAACVHCDMAVMVNLRPAPNETDVVGEAVALNCPVTDA